MLSFRAFVIKEICGTEQDEVYAAVNAGFVVAVSATC